MRKVDIAIKHNIVNVNNTKYMIMSQTRLSNCNIQNAMRIERSTAQTHRLSTADSPTKSVSLRTV